MTAPAEATAELIQHITAYIVKHGLPAKYGMMIEYLDYLHRQESAAAAVPETIRDIMAAIPAPVRHSIYNKIH